MIEWKKSERIDSLVALLSRMGKKHALYEKIDDTYIKLKSGLKGERQVDFYLNQLTQPQLKILPNIRLYTPYDTFFEMDRLIIFPTFILIVEVKNIYGTLIYDFLTQQFIRKIGDVEEGFPNPFLQVAIQKRNLDSLLRNHNLGSVKIETLIVISHPTTILKLVNLSHVTDQHNMIIHAQRLIFEVEKMIEKDCDLSVINQNQIASIINEKHTSLKTNIVDEFQVKIEDILKGVFCQDCGNRLQRLKRTWKYEKCGKTNRDAHLKALIEYFSLYPGNSSIKDISRFLAIDNLKVVRHMLQSANVSFVGNGKARRYYVNRD